MMRKRTGSGQCLPRRGGQWVRRSVAALAALAAAGLARPVPASAQEAAAPPVPGSASPAPGVKTPPRTWVDPVRKWELVEIPPGSFWMGTEEPKGEPTERPRHRVEITKPFWMGRHEVTQAQWEAVMGSNPSSVKGPSLPVTNVSWDDVQAFLYALNDGSCFVKYRLPTEAEWEYAARAGTDTLYPFGDDPAPLAEYAWFVANSGGNIQDVGKLKPNPWGLHDTLGNVGEWCSDWADTNPYSASGPSRDPQGAEGGAYKVTRGGGKKSEAALTRPGRRSWQMPHMRFLDVGLRVVSGPPGTVADNQSSGCADYVTGNFHASLARRAAAQGDKKEQLKSVADALAAYRAGAEKGDARAQFRLAGAYFEGVGVEKDPTQALTWYRKAAEGGDRFAQLVMGIDYTYGEGVPKDPAQAAVWLWKSAEQGLDRAQLALAEAYANGQGVPKKPGVAFFWYRRAAEQGRQRAQIALYLAYIDGIGVAKNPKEALVWLKKAAAGNDDPELTKAAQDTLRQHQR